MTESVFITTSTTECPTSEITLSGKTADELSSLSTDISNYSDGYNLSLQITFDGFFWTYMAY
jgi:hypothetical protein